MTTYGELGDKLQQIRRTRDKRLEDVSNVLGITKTYLSKVENGHKRPSVEFLIKIARFFSLSNQELVELVVLAKYQESKLKLLREEVIDIRDDVIKTQDAPGKKVQINMPNIPVLYTDSAFVTRSEFGLVVDFAQSVASTSQQNIVARVGMSISHAEALVRVLQEKIEEQKKG